MNATRAPMAVLGLVARLAVGGVFLFAAVPKVQDPAAFADSIANYHVVPETAASVLAVVTPVIELVVGAALILGLYVRGAALLSIGMLAVFTVAMAQAFIRGIDIDCGCFGSAKKMSVGWSSFARNAALIAASAVVLALPASMGLGSLMSRRRPSPPDLDEHPKTGES